MRLLNFKDQDKLLRAVRAAEELTYNNNHLMLFLDFSIETQKLWRPFDAVKAGLRSKGIKYSVLFPAKLWVIDGETVHFFTSPREAAKWLETVPPLG